MMTRRYKRILMDYLCGMKMWAIAEREGVHLSRVSQMIKVAKDRIGYHNGMTKQQAGAALYRPNYSTNFGVPRTPAEAFYNLDPATVWQRNGTLEEFYSDAVKVEQRDKDWADRNWSAHGTWPLGNPYMQGWEQ